MALTGIRRNHDFKILQFQELASNSILNFEVIPKTFKVYLRHQRSNRSNNKEFNFFDRVVKIPPSPSSHKKQKRGFTSCWQFCKKKKTNPTRCKIKLLYFRLTLAATDGMFLKRYDCSELLRYWLREFS